jgi:putative ABC transport system permease protein
MMRPHDAFFESLENLGDHKLRTTLTMLGMMFGVGAVIAMLSIGAGAEREALALIDKLGVRNVVVRAKEKKPEELQELRKKSLGLSQRDEEALREAIPGIELTAPRITLEPYKILSANGKTEGAQVYGVSHRQRAVASLTLAEGRFLDAQDERTHAQVVVIGAGVRRDLFGTGEALGKDLKVNDVWLEVVGVLASEATEGTSIQGVALASSEREIYLPFTTALRKFDRPPLKSPLTELVLRLEPSAPPAETGAVVSALLDKLHAGAEDFEVIVPEALMQQSKKTQRLFNLVMGCIAGISLLVGGIGIMNIMLASVLERTREIGIRRAVGAHRRDILFQFLVMAFSLALLGGLTGVLLGVGISRVVAAYAAWPTVVTLSSIVLSLGVSMTVGVLSGMYPASRAAQLDPIQALHYE